MLREELSGVLLTMLLVGWIVMRGNEARAIRVKRDDELHSIGLSGLHVIGTRFINEHHEVFDYPGDKGDDDDDSLAADEDPDKEKDEDDDDDKNDDYHNPIYDHVRIDKDDYREFGDVDKDSDDEYPKKKHRKHKD